MTKPITENKMGVMPEGKLLINMALPLIASMLVQALYNIVDSLYVARISESAVTALSLAFPIQNLQIGFATGIGVGVNALFSRALGEKNRDRGSHVAGNGMFLCFVMTAVFMLFGFFGARPFFEMQSDVAETVNGGTAFEPDISTNSNGNTVLTWEIPNAEAGVELPPIHYSCKITPLCDGNFPATRLWWRDQRCSRDLFSS